MRLRDFEIVAGPGFKEERALQRGSAMEREFNGFAKAVAEEVRYAFTGRPRIEAPFGKLIVSMLNVEAGASLRERDRRVENIGGVVQVTVAVRESDLRADRQRRNEALLDATEAGLRLLEEDLGWSSAEMHEIVRELREKGEELGTIEFDSLSRADRRTGRRARVFYVVGDDRTAIDVVVSDPDGTEVRRERVAESDVMFWPERFFPVRSAVMKDGVFVLRDADREPLAAVLVRDVF